MKKRTRRTKPAKGDQVDGFEIVRPTKVRIFFNFDWLFGVLIIYNNQFLFTGEAPYY